MNVPSTDPFPFPTDRPAPREAHEKVERRCNGAGEFEVGVQRDEFGNWDTETYQCPGCPDCRASRRGRYFRPQVPGGHRR